jgi:hypothetical protein
MWRVTERRARERRSSGFQPTGEFNGFYQPFINMVNPSEYLQWYYLLYLLPGGLALLLLLLSALGGGAHSHHAGGMHSHHSGLGHGHGPLGHGKLGHHAPTPHQNASVGGAGRFSLLTFFGLGRVPAPLVWGSALLGWGVFGFWATQFWQSYLHVPAVFVLPALVTATAGAVATEKVTVETAARLLPRDESFATGNVELCGLHGTAVFPVDAKRGRVHVYDVYGTLHDVPARTSPGQGQIGRGRSVLVVDYDAVTGQMVVEEIL